LLDKERIKKPLSVALVEDTPAGSLTVAASDNGLALVSFYGLRYFNDLILHNTDSAGSKSMDIVQEAVRQIGEYFNHQRKVFDLPLDLGEIPAFRRKVLLETARIPFGKTISYGELAARVQNPAAARAVGGALAHNPVAVVVPCHRVVASDGSMHGFSSPGGINTKIMLLKLEGCQIKNNRLVV
jgi:methylated-DNA-[protein]-cysteine S-methyltransferase